MCAMRWSLASAAEGPSFVGGLLRCAVLALLLCGALALTLHHSDSGGSAGLGEAGPATIATVAAESPEPSDVGHSPALAGVLQSVDLNDLAGCGALALCCVLGLALLRRLIVRRKLLVSFVERYVATPIVPGGLVMSPAPQPSLTALSVSRR